MKKNIYRIGKKKLYQFVNLSLPENSSEEENQYYERLFRKKLFRKIFWSFLFLLPFFIFIFYLGTLFRSPSMDHSRHKEVPKNEEKGKVKFWTCSMHPQIKMPNNKKKCPICFMDLVPVKEDGGEDLEPGELRLSPGAVKLAEITTVPVLYRELSHTLSLVGKVAYNETRVADISIWTPGQSRLHRMFVDFTGASVEKGDPLFQVYSPDLIATQGEFLSTYQTWKKMKERKISPVGADENLQATKQKLLDLGLTPQQIERLEEEKKIEEIVTIYSPVSGTVIEKRVNEGEWHTRGRSVYRIADLSQVWVMLDVYEIDIQWLRYAQKVQVEVEAYPGESFAGRISFIDPFLHEETRTIKVRVNLENPRGKLRPGMFVRAHIQVKIGEEGKIFDEYLMGKWLCPLHPGVVSKKEGRCSKPVSLNEKTLCQKKLLAASKLGYATPNSIRRRTLTVPKTSPLLTGKRAIVYVEKKKIEYDNEGNPQIKSLSYKGREVKLGPEVGNYYVVLYGLKEGERVVKKGAFKIDSSLQIMAQPSMMSSDAKASMEKMEKIPHEHQVSAKVYRKNIDKFIDLYLEVAKNLSQDTLDQVSSKGIKMEELLENILEEKTLLKNSPNLREELLKEVKELQEYTRFLSGKKLEMVRRDFLDLSQYLIEFLKHFGHPYPQKLHIMYCSMYRNDLGGFWLQKHEKITNPYYGSEMLRCGDPAGLLSPMPKK